MILPTRYEFQSSTSNNKKLKNRKIEKKNLSFFFPLPALFTTSPSQGMSETERKLEDLTQQIEAEIERKEKKGNCYGKWYFSIILERKEKKKVTIMVRGYSSTGYELSADLILVV